MDSSSPEDEDFFSIFFLNFYEDIIIVYIYKKRKNR
jgi:hypothetical protein